MDQVTTITKENIQDKIFMIRGLQVILDRDLTELYQVETRTLKQSVKRNSQKFPQNFMMELSDNEINTMVSQSVIPSKQQLGGAKPFENNKERFEYFFRFYKEMIKAEGK